MTKYAVTIPPQAPPPQVQLELPPAKSRFRQYALPANLLFLTLFLILVSANTQSGWVMVIAGILLASLLTSFFASRAATRGLSVTHKFPTGVQAGEECRVAVVINNTTKRGKHLVHLIEDFPLTLAGIMPQLRFLIDYIPPEDSVTISYTLVSPTRGSHIFEFCELESGFPFGVFTFRRKYTCTGDILQLAPRTTRLSERAAPRAEALRAGHPHPAKGQSDDFYGLRDYVYGDNLRLVHWSASAHAGQLQIKETQAETEPCRLVIAIDATRSFPLLTAQQDDLESALRLAVSLAETAEDQGQNVLLATAYQGQVVTITSSERDAMLSNLQAELDPAGTEHLRSWLLKQQDKLTQLVYIAAPGTPQPSFKHQNWPESVWRVEVGPGTEAPTLYLELTGTYEARRRRYLPVRSRRIPLTWRRQVQEWDPLFPASFYEGRRAYQASPADEEQTLSFLLQALSVV